VHLSQVAFSYNASAHESTKYTPFFLIHGVEPRWDVDLKLGSTSPVQYSHNDYADILIRRLERAHELTREHLNVTATRMRSWYDKKVHVQSFEAGEEVLVLNLRQYPGKCSKWMRRYTDLGTVVRKINDVTYEIFCKAWKKNPTRIFHVDKLKRSEKFVLQGESDSPAEEN